MAKAGFTTLKEDNLQLLVNVPATSNLSMRIKGEASVVDVTSTGVQVNSQDATIGNAFGTSQIAALPFEGRDPTQILSLQPGVTFVGAQTNAQQDNDSRGGSVSGARSDQTNITLDGIDDNDQVKGYAFEGALRSTLDSLQEFRVTTSNSNADEGRSSGAQVALVTKGGTNIFSWHSLRIQPQQRWLCQRLVQQAGRVGIWPAQCSRPIDPQHFRRNRWRSHPQRSRVLLPSVRGSAHQGKRPDNAGRAQRQSARRHHAVSLLPERMLACPPTADQVQTLTAAQLAGMDQRSPRATEPVPGRQPAGCGPDPNVGSPVSTNILIPTPPPLETVSTLWVTPFAAPTPGSLNTYVAKFDFNLTQNQHVFVRGGMQGDNLGSGPEFPGQPQSLISTNTSKGVIVSYTATLRSNLINNFRYGFIRQGTGNDRPD